MILIKKPWGQEEILETNKFYTVKRLTMNSGCKCSLQYHKEKTETIYVLKGNLYIHLGSDKDSLEVKKYDEGEYITIDINVIHRMEAKEKECIYLECSTSQLDDVIRINDDYGRN